MIRVLVVEDSAVAREFLVHVLSQDPGIQVIGTAADGEEAIEAVRLQSPDAITMDINMPRMNGFEATRKIMETSPTPIVIVSGSYETKEVATVFRSMDAGALAVVPRPAGYGNPNHDTTVKELVQTVKLMSEVRLVRRRPRQAAETPPARARLERASSGIKIVAIGASTGGPVVLQTILSLLPKAFPVPIVIVQHMAAGFIGGFAEWLGQTCGRPVGIASDRGALEAGAVYVAPDGLQLGVAPGPAARLAADDPENGLRPSVSYLFRSVAQAFGECAAGVILTGMGQDGAAELKLMRDRGAITFAQDEASSVIFGMPGEAIRKGGATHVLPPDQIAVALDELTRRP